MRERGRTTRPCIATMLALLLLSTTCAGSGSEGGAGGFGADTPGGAGQPVYRVTSLGDSGTGSLRDAVSQGNRHVVFDVAGTISLRSDVQVRGDFLTIDGSTAPPPGITLRNAGLRLSGNHDVIVRGVRIRNPGVNSSEGDGITIKDGAHNIVIDHVSVDGCGDGSIDITRGARDVTVSWSILSGCPRNMLIKFEATRISLHRNVFVDSQWRNPNVAYTDEHLPNVSPDTTADVRNNLVWGWGESGGGTILQCGAKVNVVANYYSSPGTSTSRQAKAIVDDGCPGARSGSGPLFFTSGNLSGDGLSFDLNSLGNQPAPFPAASVDTRDACTAAHEALTGAGARPLDAVDSGRLGRIRLPSC